MFAGLRKPLHEAYTEFDKIAASEDRTGEQLLNQVKVIVEAQLTVKRATVEAIINEALDQGVPLSMMSEHLNKWLMDHIQNDNKVYAPKARLSTVIQEAISRRYDKK